MVNIFCLTQKNHKIKELSVDSYQLDLKKKKSKRVHITTKKSNDFESFVTDVFFFLFNLLN